MAAEPVPCARATTRPRELKTWTTIREDDGPEKRATNGPLRAELSVLGKFVEIPERLFVRRIHKGSSVGNTGNAGGCAPTWAGHGPACAAP